MEGLEFKSMHLQAAFSRLRFLFSISGPSKLGRLLQTKNPQQKLRVHDLTRGEGGIRTLGTVARTTVFETVPIDHSGTSPKTLHPTTDVKVGRKVNLFMESPANYL